MPPRKNVSGTTCDCCEAFLSPLEFPGKLTDKKTTIDLFKKVSDVFFDDGEKYIAIIDVCMPCFSNDCPCKGLAPKVRSKIGKLIDTVEMKKKQK